MVVDPLRRRQFADLVDGPGAVDRDGDGHVVGLALLPCPQLGAVGAILAHHRGADVVRADVALAGDVDVAGGVDGHGRGQVVARASGLARPDLVAGGVVLAHECVVLATGGLAGQAAEHPAGDIDRT